MLLMPPTVPICVGWDVVDVRNGDNSMLFDGGVIR